MTDRVNCPSPEPAPYQRWAALALLAVAMLSWGGLVGCATADTGVAQVEEDVPYLSDAPAMGELGRSEDVLLVRPMEGETLEGLSTRVLGHGRHWWWIADSNGLRRRDLLSGDMVLRIPLHDGVLRDIRPDGFQVVPVLSWHRFDGSGGRLSVSGPEFAEQLNYLADHDYRVVSLAALERWLRNDVPLPQRAVVLTIDDGHRSVHRTAWPLLSKFDLPATLFIYTDYVGRGGVNWRELREMQASGRLTVHSHSKSHDDLVLLSAERPEALDDEFAVPRRRIGQRLGISEPAYVAYPYGSADHRVATAARQHGHRLGLTVRPGGNTFYSPRMLLRRTMVFSDRGMAGFINGLDTWRALPADGATQPVPLSPRAQGPLRAPPGGVSSALREQAEQAEQAGDLAAAVDTWQQLEALAHGPGSPAGPSIESPVVPIWVRVSAGISAGIVSAVGVAAIDDKPRDRVSRDVDAIVLAREAQARLRALAAEHSESALIRARAARRAGQHARARHVALTALASDPHHSELRAFLRR